MFLYVSPLVKREQSTVYAREIRAHTRVNHCYTREPCSYTRAPWLCESDLASYERESPLYESAMFLYESPILIPQKNRQMRTFVCCVYEFSTSGCFHARSIGPSFSVSTVNEPLEYLSEGRNVFTSIVSVPFEVSITRTSFFFTNNTPNTR